MDKEGQVEGINKNKSVFFFIRYTTRHAQNPNVQISADNTLRIVFLLLCSCFWFQLCYLNEVEQEEEDALVEATYQTPAKELNRGRRKNKANFLLLTKRNGPCLLLHFTIRKLCSVFRRAYSQLA